MRRKLTGVAMGAVLLLSACEGDGGGNSVNGIATLGQAFVRAFNQARNSTPINAQSANLKLTPTKTPFNP
ncbi:hypothetical protein [Marinovum sp.]|uniref:hypothetical protein n=1 Tax=Marinovum sp. TaxID=2024839 RepID=UPI002B2701B8|nr:hypothetical protein [Marinovum sp.]